jgi:hypothetical protein
LKKALGAALEFVVKTVPGASGSLQKQIDGEVNKAIKELLVESGKQR